MPWPNTTISTVNLDAGTDSPASARPDLKALVDNVNTMQAARGAVDGIASTDSTGKVPTGQLPTIPANQGGTGQTVFNVGDILFANTTTTLQKLSAGALGFVLSSNGPGAAPSWKASNGLTLDNTWTGINAFNGQVVINSTLQVNSSVGTSGQALVSRGAGQSPIWTTSPGTLIGIQVFTSSGTYGKNINNPSFIVVELVGGGSGAGAGLGGSAGGYSSKKIPNATLGATETVTIGAGGGVGAAGGTTSFGSHLSATGGNWTSGFGGVGSGGDINLAGGDFTQSATGAASFFGGGRTNNLSGGAPGSGGSSNASSGRSGIVIVREYA